MSLKDSLTKEKPWAWLHMTRRQYDKARMWKKSGMIREEFGKKILVLPKEVIELIKENVQAEILIDAICIPHACGDEPMSEKELAARVMYSPHAWG